MNATFADSSYFLALLIPNDQNHAAAARWAQQNDRPMVTTEYVIVEVANFLSPVRTRGLFRILFRTVRQHERCTVVGASERLLMRGSDLYDARTDKAWSLTDCISFVVMQDHGLMDALTADKHFAQAGFRCLLESSA